MTGPINPNVSSDTPALFQGTYQSGSTTVGTSVVAVCVVPGGYNGGVVVQAPSTNTAAVHLGGSGVTTSTGVSLAAGATLTLPGGKGVSRTLYGVSTAAAQAVTFMFAD